MDREGLGRLMRRLSALERRVSALCRTGRVAAVRAPTLPYTARTDPYAVRVDVGPDADGAPVVTDWLPVLVPRAGEVRAWTPCTVGERVCVLSPGGEDTAAFVLPALGSGDFEPPAKDLAVERTSWRAAGDADTEVARLEVRRGETLETTSVKLACGTSSIVMTHDEILLDADHIGLND